MDRWVVFGVLSLVASVLCSATAGAQLEFPTQCEAGPFYLPPAVAAEYRAFNEERGFDPLPTTCLSARLSDEEREMVRLINVARLERGLYMYECDDRLIDIAKVRTDDIAGRCAPFTLNAHFDAAGRRYDEIMTDHGYVLPGGGRVVGEVIHSLGNARSAVQGWMSSCAAHYPQLVAEDLSAVGTSIGFNQDCPVYTHRALALFGNLPMVYPRDLEGGGDTGSGGTGGADTGGSDTGGTDTGGGDTGGADTGGADTGGGDTGGADTGGGDTGGRTLDAGIDDWDASNPSARSGSGRMSGGCTVTNASVPADGHVLMFAFVVAAWRITRLATGRSRD